MKIMTLLAMLLVLSFVLKLSNKLLPFTQKYSGTSGYEFNSFHDGVCKVNYSHTEARFTCNWHDPFQPIQTQSYKV